MSSKKNGRVAGVITEDGEEIRARIVINAEGSQGVVAVKAGVREKYPRQVISLADVYDYEMSKEDVDHVFGNTLRFCWAWDEQRLAPPLGFGNGLMVWSYRRSIHFCQDECLALDGGKIPDLKEAFAEYQRNITTKLPWWRDGVEPRAKMRAHMWETFEIFVGLNEQMRKMPSCTDGMILVGDAAGLEGTELCNGVPAAWFSADIAADVAIEALYSEDISADFLKRYEYRVKQHPMIQWSISGTNRYNLRFAQKTHNFEELKKYVHRGWGLGCFTHVSTPLLKMIFSLLRNGPTVVTSWIRMFLRYYYNWTYERYGFEARDINPPGLELKRRTLSFFLFWVFINSMDILLRVLSPVIIIASRFLEPLCEMANPLMVLLLPCLEVLLKAWAKLEPFTSRLSNGIVDFIKESDPVIFDQRR